MKNQVVAARFLQVSSWVFLVYLIYAQGISAVDYDFGIAMGTQEPAEGK